MIASMNPYSDEYLFTQYLQKKGTDAPLPPILIEDYDLYSQAPWEIFDTSISTAREQTFFVFTPLRKNKSRVLRTAGSGTWKEQHAKKIINCGELVGYRKSFKFQDGCDSSATRGRWIMYEFSMCVERSKCVLCKIKYYRDCEESKDKGIVILDNLPDQFEDKNQQAKRARLLHDSGDRTGDFAVALPSSTVDGAQSATAQAVSSSNRDANSFAAEQVNGDDEWINQLIDMDINPMLDATAMLESTLGIPDK